MSEVPTPNDLKTNDAEGAYRLARLYMKQGRWTPDIAELVVMSLPDDKARREYLTRIEPHYKAYVSKRGGDRA